ncbi:MAG: type III-A CRISPR-associated protein Cas10/Csm1, partial [Dictyoglomus sp.]
CRSFVELTDNLKTSSFLVEKRVDIFPREPETWNEFFEKLGYRLDFVDIISPQNSFQGVYQLEDVSLKENFIPDGFLLGSFKIEESNFEKIAEKNISPEGYGDNKLAYLKMDADNMGNIFRKLSDMEREREGLALTRYGILSRRIELFFGKEVLKIIKEKPKGTIYPVFIGGDDLLLIGAYNEINDLAKEIREKYYEYTGSKEIFTISGGISYFSDNFPLIRGTRILEEVLEKAKNFVYPEEDKPKKDKICVEGEVLSYKEYQEALNLAEEITQKILKTDEKNKVSRAIISKIEKSIKGFNPLLEQSLKRKISPPAVWRFMYYLRDQKEIAERLANIIMDNLLREGEKIKNPRFILVATKIAKMKTRKLEGGR